MRRCRYGGSRKYKTGLKHGKRALLSLTTGGPRAAYEKDGSNGAGELHRRPEPESANNNPLNGDVDQQPYSRLEPVGLRYVLVLIACVDDPVARASTSYRMLMGWAPNTPYSLLSVFGINPQCEKSLRLMTWVLDVHPSNYD